MNIALLKGCKLPMYSKQVLPINTQSGSIFYGSTRLSGGFNEAKMYKLFSSFHRAKKIEEYAAKEGFRYAGHTGSASKSELLMNTKEKQP